ncbi:protein of unknown function [Azospirillum baldaniorum]|uniref:Uncharacterized protein n=1 Tax=Azospirillum baldaniorum TaxID=1064539 RepID=A0A9P1JNH6_9PROT|nr:protein of unknown function [Azospirillum baldaniorum]
MVPDPVCEPDLFERLTLLTSNGRGSAPGRFFLRPPALLTAIRCHSRAMTAWLTCAIPTATIGKS